MDTRNGRIYEQLDDVPAEVRPHVVPMTRRPTAKQLRRRRVGRNDICPCNSGKKFKFCCFKYTLLK